MTTGRKKRLEGKARESPRNLKSMRKNWFVKEVCDATDMVAMFHRDIEYGPECVCTCCDQLWYKHSVTPAGLLQSKISDELRKDCLTGTISHNNTEWICNTCSTSLKQSRMPSCAKANGMVFPIVPPQLLLSPLEERLVSPRIPFMQLRELPRGGQLSITGNIVNVPANINTTVQVWPLFPLS